jgi:hypothetical protein
MPGSREQTQNRASQKDDEEDHGVLLVTPRQNGSVTNVKVTAKLCSRDSSV